MSTLITNISKLLHIEDKGRKYKRGHELNHFPITENAWLKIENKKIAGFGSMDSCPDDMSNIIDAKGDLVLTHSGMGDFNTEEFRSYLKSLQ